MTPSLRPAAAGCWRLSDVHSWRVSDAALPPRPGSVTVPHIEPRCRGVPDQGDPAGRSGPAGTGVEQLAVQVHVELDRGEPARRRVDDRAERGETPLGRA